MSEDTQRQIRIAKIKQWESQHHSFLEIVLMYNATFGTNHFAEVLSKDPLVETAARALLTDGQDTKAKRFVKDLETIFFG
jgi:hypothetical protein